MFRGWIFGTNAGEVADDRITNELERLMIYGVRNRSEIE
jgi:hypothetical protein